MDNLQIGVITLLKSAITGEKYELPPQFDLSRAITLAKEHQIIPMLYYGAVNCGIRDQTAEMQKLFISVCSFISFNEQQQYELGNLFKAFDEKNIEYMPLKGTVLKKLYPKSEMRTMSDADILIRTEQYERIATIMEDLGYNFKYESDHELVWQKEIITIELHKRTMGTINEDFIKYFGDGWKFAKLQENSRYAMSNEDFYIFLFIHFAKHYRVAGIGIKHMLDLWIFRKAVKLDNNYVNQQLELLGVSKFHSNILATLEVWFEDKEGDGKSDFITGVIFNSGAYGTKESEYIAKIVRLSAQNGNNISLGKAKKLRILQTIFPTFENMCKNYPILVKATVLLPFFWFVRIFDVLLFKRNKIKSNTQRWKDSSVEKIEEYKVGLNYVGLDFKFGE